MSGESQQWSMRQGVKTLDDIYCEATPLGVGKSVFRGLQGPLHFIHQFLGASFGEDSRNTDSLFLIRAKFLIQGLFLSCQGWNPRGSCGLDDGPGCIHVDFEVIDCRDDC